MQETFKVNSRGVPIWIALTGGFCLSAVLLVLSYTFRSRVVLWWLQIAGFFTSMVLFGVHSASRAEIILIAFPVNGIVYSMIFLFVLWIFGRATTK
jgi:hypothetical protein